MNRFDEDPKRFKQDMQRDYPDLTRLMDQVSIKMPDHLTDSAPVPHSRLSHYLTLPNKQLPDFLTNVSWLAGLAPLLLFGVVVLQMYLL